MIKFFHSLKFAFSGLKYALQKEQSFQIQFVIALTAIILILFIPLAVWEIIAILIMVFLVLALELVNTTAEKIIDCFKPEISPHAKLIKDLMAAAVLVVSLGSIIIGVLIFLPKFLNQ